MFPFCFPTDVKFISNPPSMIAAGSVVAAVQGLHLGNTNTFLSYPCLTHFLSKVIKCDPVSEPFHPKRKLLGLAYIVNLN